MAASPEVATEKIQAPIAISTWRRLRKTTAPNANHTIVVYTNRANAPAESSGWSAVGREDMAPRLKTANPNKNGLGNARFIVGRFISTPAAATSREASRKQSDRSREGTGLTAPPATKARPK